MRKYIILFIVLAFSSLMAACSSCGEEKTASYISCDSTLSYKIMDDSFIISDYHNGEVLKRYTIEREDSNWKSEDSYKAYELVDGDSIKEHTLLIYPNVNGNHYEYFIRMDYEVARTYKTSE